MRWFGYVGPSFCGVTTDFSKIEYEVKMTPYSTFNLFRTEEEAWNFVQTHKHKYGLQGINHYGDIFESLYAEIVYYIKEKGIYINIDTSKLGFVRLGKVSEDIAIQYFSERIECIVPVSNLNPVRIDSHCIAILNILKIVKGIIDINLILPNFSIFYLLTQYSGSNLRYNRLITEIQKRTGNIAYTIRKDRY